VTIFFSWYSEDSRDQATSEAQALFEAYVALGDLRGMEDEVAAFMEEEEDYRVELAWRWKTLIGYSRRCEKADAEVKRLRQEKAADSLEKKELAKSWWFSADKYRYVFLKFSASWAPRGLISGVEHP
jgi:hypothetical protein